MVTFFQTTFVLVTSVHIRNISAVTDLILTIKTSSRQGQGNVIPRSRRGQGKIRAISRQGHGKAIKARLRQSQGKVKETSRLGKTNVTSRLGKNKVKVMSRGTVKARIKKGQGKDKVRSRQCKYNLNLNYNLMGFDIIEINPVCYYCIAQDVSE